VSIEDLIAGAGTAAPALRPAQGVTGSSREDRSAPRPVASSPASARPAPAAAVSAPSATSARPQSPAIAAAKPASATPPASPAPSGNLKDALLTEIKRAKTVFYNTVVAQAQKIEVAGDRVTFTFSPNHRTLREMFEQNRAWIESAAQQVSGRKIAVESVQTTAPTAAASEPSLDLTATAAEAVKQSDRKSALREQAMADAGVQTMLEVFPAEIRDVEEM
jgi:hypothetical protein